MEDFMFFVILSPRLLAQNMDVHKHKHTIFIIHDFLEISRT